ncbi:MAG: hypothetical protein NVSMB48_13490 [Marmoricola sp.]
MVTVWAMESVSVQVTLVPTFTVNVAGRKDSRVVCTVVAGFEAAPPLDPDPELPHPVASTRATAVIERRPALRRIRVVVDELMLVIRRGARNGLDAVLMTAPPVPG